MKEAICRARDDGFFIGGDDMHRYGCAWRRNHGVPGSVGRLLGMQAEERQSFADARPYGRSVFTDAAGERQHIQPAERRRVSANLLFDGVAVERGCEPASRVK